jgi:hypothetical protein
VLISAATASEAYQKAAGWGRRYAAEPPAAMELLGVSHLTTVGEELGDGVEICGRFFEEPDVRSRREELVPPAGQLEAERWERGGDIPLGAPLSAEQVAMLRRRFGDPAAG